MDGTGAAFATIAALLRAGELQALAQQVEQTDARLDFELMGDAVDLNMDARECLEALPPGGRGLRALGRDKRSGARNSNGAAPHQLAPR